MKTPETTVTPYELGRAYALVSDLPCEAAFAQAVKREDVVYKDYTVLYLSTLDAEEFSRGFNSISVPV